MFDDLKNSLNSAEILAEANNILSEMADGGAAEDSILESIVVSDEEDAKIKKLVDEIPDGPLGNTEEISDKDLIDAAKNIPDPTIDELLNDKLI